jgi:hypothetical protein
MINADRVQIGSISEDGKYISIAVVDEGRLTQKWTLIEERPTIKTASVIAEVREELSNDKGIVIYPIIDKLKNVEIKGKEIEIEDGEKKLRHGLDSIIELMPVEKKIEGSYEKNKIRIEYGGTAIIDIGNVEKEIRDRLEIETKIEGESLVIRSEEREVRIDISKLTEDIKVISGRYKEETKRIEIEMTTGKIEVGIEKLIPSLTRNEIVKNGIGEIEVKVSGEGENLLKVGEDKGLYVYRVVEIENKEPKIDSYIKGGILDSANKKVVIEYNREELGKIEIDLRSYIQDKAEYIYEGNIRKAADGKIGFKTYEGGIKDTEIYKEVRTSFNDYVGLNMLTKVSDNLRVVGTLQTGGRSSTWSYAPTDRRSASNTYTVVWNKIDELMYIDSGEVLDLSLNLNDAGVVQSKPYRIAIGSKIVIIKKKTSLTGFAATRIGLPTVIRSNTNKIENSNQMTLPIQGNYVEIVFDGSTWSVIRSNFIL